MPIPVSLGHNEGAASSTTIGLTAAAPILNGDLVVVQVGNVNSRTVSTLTDGVNNYSLIPGAALAVTGVGAGAEVELWFCAGCLPNANPSFVATYSGAASDRTIGACRIPGMRTDSSVVDTVNKHDQSVGATISTGTLSQALEVVIGTCYVNNNTALSASAPFTQLWLSDTIGVSADQEYDNVNSTASVTYAPVTLPNWYGLILVSFRVASPILVDEDSRFITRTRRRPTAMLEMAREVFAPPAVIFPNGWQVQDSQPPHPRPERAAAVMPIEPGNEAPFVYVPPLQNVPAWQFSPQEVQPPTLRVSQRMGGLVPGENSGANAQPPVVQFVDLGWPVQPPQPPALPYRKMFAGTISGDASDQNDQPPVTPFFPLGFPVQPPQPPAPANRPQQRAAGTMRGDDGAYDVRRGFFDFGFHVQPWQPPHRGAERGAGAIAQGDFGAYDRLRRFFDYGWFVQPLQPPHPAPERRAGGIMPIEPGNEDRYIFVPPTLIWESGAQNYGPPGRRYRQEAAIMRGVDGTDAPFIVYGSYRSTELEPVLRRPPRRFADFGDTGIEAIPIPNVWGWSPQPADMPTRRISSVPAAFQPLLFPRVAEPSWTQDQVDLLARRRRVAATEMEPAFVPLPAPVRWGFDPDTDAFARPRRHVLPTVDERLLPPFPRAAWGWAQAEAPGRYARRAPVVTAPDVFLPRPIGWGFASTLPDLRPRPRRALDRGYELVTNLPLTFYDGWEVQPPQPPRPGWNRAGALMRGVDSIDFPMIVPVFDGWEPTLFYPPHPRPERGAAIMIGDVWGAWGLFYYLIPSGAIASDFALYAAIAFDVGPPP